jgi:hypothetical protein
MNHYIAFFAFALRFFAIALKAFDSKAGSAED